MGHIRKRPYSAGLRKLTTNQPAPCFSMSNWKTLSSPILTRSLRGVIRVAFSPAPANTKGGTFRTIFLATSGEAQYPRTAG